MLISGGAVMPVLLAERRREPVRSAPPIMNPSPYPRRPGPARSIIGPSDDDPALETGQRQGSSLLLDGIPRARREPHPELDRHDLVRASPGADDVPVHEQRPRPDARGPQGATTVVLRDEQPTVGPVQEEVGVAARKQTSRGGRPQVATQDRFVSREDPRIAD